MVQTIALCDTGTRDEVLVFNTEGTMMRRLQHADTDHKTVQMDTFLLTKHSQVNGSGWPEGVFKCQLFNLRQKKDQFFRY